MARTRDWRRWKRHVTLRRRLKKDWNQHYRDLTCPCRTDAKFRSILADTPTRCSARCCGNPRRHEKGIGKETMQERRGRLLPEDQRDYLML